MTGYTQAHAGTISSDDRLSIIMPAYNEADNLESIVRESFAELDALSDHVDVVVVDDASNDSSAEVLLKLQKEFPKLCVYRNPQNIGCHPSTLVAWPLAEGEYRLFLASDGQIPPSEMRNFVEKAKEGFDVVYSWRVNRQDPTHRLWLSKCYNILTRVFFGIPVNDVDSSSLLTERAVETILPNIRSDSAFISVEILLEAKRQGLKIGEVQISHRPRTTGVAKGINLKDACFVPLNFMRMFFWFCQQKLKS
ncbi:MAG: glycosyltransferase family 2 protein [Vampirovibrionales bacterium]|nr:glycosyltransferase family 2 protein [Vampirovibrionales bacterium]